MRPVRILSNLFLACIIFISCQKEPVQNHDPDPQRDPPVKLHVDKYDFSGFDCELIITEPAGKKLLDTIAKFGDEFELSLSTSEKLVDVTIISKFSNNLYTAFTYMGVDPRNWTRLSLYEIYDFGVREPFSKTKKVTYVNVQEDLLDMTQAIPNYYSDYVGNSSIAFVINDKSITTSPYYFDGTQFNYLIFPKYGRYKLTPFDAGDETIDVSDMDIGNFQNFSTMPGYKYQSSTLFAVPDTNNFASSLLLFVHGMKSDLGDIVYPNFPFQKYGLEAYTDGIGKNERQVMFRFSDNIPETITSYESADYQIVKKEADDFEVNFPRLKPSYYQLSVYQDALRWKIISSPDATVLHPITFLKNLKSTLLQGLSPDQNVLSGFEMDNFLDLNYQQFSNFLAQPREKVINKVTSFYSLATPLR